MVFNHFQPFIFWPLKPKDLRPFKKIEMTIFQISPLKKAAVSTYHKWKQRWARKSRGENKCAAKKESQRRYQLVTSTAQNEVLRTGVNQFQSRINQNDHTDLNSFP